MPQRVVENLNQALHATLSDDPAVMLLGEDILDPYGGAFKVVRGLSSHFADRVLTTPVSEEAVVGIAAGLSLFGHKPIVEIMFGDFMALAFDQILNFVSKSVAMYGRKVDLNLVIRCPVGGNRGYGPTHSQSPQKHFVGMPGLELYELSPFHENRALLRRLLNLGTPCIFFEDKALYGQQMFEKGVVNDLFSFDFVGPQNDFARVYSPDFETNHCAIVAPGGMSARCLEAARRLFISHEIETQIFVPSRLYPFDAALIHPQLASADAIFVVEEAVAGGTWGCEVAENLYRVLWERLKNPIVLIHSRASVIPAAPHLERQVLVQADDIYGAVVQAVGPRVASASNTDCAEVIDRT